MEFDPMTPIWAQVAGHLRLEMVTGRLQPGEKLPSGRDLALQFAINPNTAARVYQELEAEGLCSTRRGLGTFVTADRARLEAIRLSLAREAAEQFLSRLDKLGLSPGDALRMVGEAAATEDSQHP
ncbi:MAG: GntR family transcriptional regulator [Clostridia bacterium]|nr:GntR family transcriptional regulator [Clostridia bacterium]